MKNCALFLFLVLLSTACTKNAFIDQSTFTAVPSVAEIRNTMSLLKNDLRDLTSSLSLKELQHLYEKPGHKLNPKMFNVDLDRILQLQNRLAVHFQQLPSISRNAQIAVLKEETVQEKNAGDLWVPYDPGCYAELQIKQQQLLL
ncbi:MAG: hypothetical protein KDD15_16370 [Lewinella sp.]|nr:hypothetical protein [Lewinella sp.]